MLPPLNTSLQRQCRAIDWVADQELCGGSILSKRSAMVVHSVAVMTSAQA
jgi:hypothetical protein